MRGRRKEGGYSLIIVLFAIVFIMTITAVFMRGALSNIKQEQIVDKNNLTVVAAEAGVDYYTWELKEYFDEIKEQVYTDIRLKAIKESEKGEGEQIPIDFKDVQLKIANTLGVKMDEKIKDLAKEGKSTLFNGYNHYLKKKSEHIVEKQQGVELPLRISGVSLGSRNQEGTDDRSLDFEMLFLIPSLDTRGSSNPSETPETTPSVGELIIKKPLLPKKGDKNIDSILSDGVTNYQDSTVTIVETFKTRGLEAQKSDIAIGSKLTTAYLDLQDTKLAAGSIESEKTFKAEDSHITVNGLILTQDTDFQKAVISVSGSYTGNGQFKAQDSDINIEGSVGASNSSDLQNVNMKVGGGYTISSTLKTRDTKIYIKDNLNVGYKSDLQDGSMFVGGNFSTSSTAELQGMTINVSGNITASTADLQNSFIKAKDFTTNPFLKASGGVIWVESMNSDRADLQDVTVCVRDLNIRDLKYSGSKIYYSNKFTSDSASAYNNKNIQKVSEDEFSKICKIKNLPGGTDSEPDTPSTDLPVALPPTVIKVEEVTYN